MNNGECQRSKDASQRPKVPPQLAPYLPGKVTGHGKAVLWAAAEWADKSGSLDSAALLAGLLEQDDSLAFKLLKSFNAVLPLQLRNDLSGFLRAQAAGVSSEPTADAIVALGGATDVADRLHCDIERRIGCGHLLIGLVREPDGAGGRILRSRGVTFYRSELALRSALIGYSHAVARR